MTTRAPAVLTNHVLEPLSKARTSVKIWTYRWSPLGQLLTELPETFSTRWEQYIAMLYFSLYTIFYIDGQLKIWATQYCLLRWSRMRTGCLCTQEDLCASLWTPSAKLTTCLTKSSLHQVCLAREHVFVARFFKRFLLFGAGNTYGVDTGYGNFTGVVGGFELFQIFLS